MKNLLGAIWNRKQTQTVANDQQSIAANDRVSVGLKSLIDLSAKAVGLNLQHSRIRSRQSGGYVSRFKGRGMEFDEARLYQPGDDIRSIDWRVTARTNKTHTKIFREERERPVFISVDNRSAMHFATRGMFKSVQAAKLAALIAWAAQRHGDRIGGQVFSEHSCQEIKPQNGKHGVLRFLNTLIKPGSSAETNISLKKALVRLNQHVRPGSQVYIISDFRGLNSKVEQHLSRLALHCQLVLVLVFDPLESHLPEKGRYRFTDDERDVIIDSSDQQKKLTYQQRFAQHKQQLTELAKKLSMDLITCSTTDDALERLR